MTVSELSPVLDRFIFVLDGESIREMCITGA
jgi:hypothetical protein